MSKVFVIAEAGVNHNGSPDMALALVDIAADAGADSVKFQTFSVEKLVAKGTPKASYQQQATGDGDQFSMLRALELSDGTYRRLVQRCHERGIEFMSTAFDEEAIDQLIGYGIARIKVPSGEVTNLPLLEALAGKRLPIILSTGMADLEEVATALALVRRVWSAQGYEPGPDGLCVLHCTSNYPAQPQDVNLRAMTSMGDAFHVPVGYSDHTLGLSVSLAAVALGARVIEKHFTIDKTLPGPDHGSSLSPHELADLVRGIRAIEACLGDGLKAPTPSELPIRALVRRSVTLTRDIPQGDVLTQVDLVLLRPGTGIPPADLARVIGRKAARPLPAGSTLQWTDLV